MRRRVGVWLVGEVQDVNLRRQVDEYARAEQLAGWIRNEPDGTVRAELEGEAEAIARAVAWLTRGAGVAAVRSYEVEELAAKGDSGFRILR